MKIQDGRQCLYSKKINIKYMLKNKNTLLECPEPVEK